ncbi:hypothetical protein LQW54_004414 [Pestalotiopsis sp. IQ-011]
MPSPSLFRRIFSPRRPGQSEEDADDTSPSRQPSSGRVPASDDEWLTTLGRFDNQVITTCEAVPRLQAQQLNAGHMSGPWYVADASEIAATGVAPDSDARELTRAAENVGRFGRLGAPPNSGRPPHPLGGILVTTTTTIERFNAITGSPVSSHHTADGGDSPTFPAPAFRTWNPMTRSLAGSRGSFRLGGDDNDSHSHTSSVNTHESERQSFESFVQHLHDLQRPDDHRPVFPIDQMSMAPSDFGHHGDTAQASDDLDHDNGIAQTSDDSGHHDRTCLSSNSSSSSEHQQTLDQASAVVDHHASAEDMTLEEAARHLELSQSSDHGNNPIASVPSLHYPTPGSQMIHLELRSHCEAVIRALEAIRESAAGIIDSDDPMNGRHGGPHYGFRYELAPYYRWAMSRIATEAELSLSVFDAQLRSSRVRDTQALGGENGDITDGDEDDQDKHEGESGDHQTHSKTM